MIKKNEFKDLKADQLRAIAKGKYRGIMSSPEEKRHAKSELCNRKLTTKKKKRNNDGWADFSRLF